MENELIMYAGEIYNPLAESEEKTSTKYFVDRWGTVYGHNPNLPEREEAPTQEPTSSSSGWEEDRR